MIVAATVWLLASVVLGLLLLRQASHPNGQYGIDFFYWHQAARDVAAGVSPYPPRYLEGPIAATDFGYKYPPTFAQALTPLAGISFLDAQAIWAVLQACLAFCGVWLAASYGGARRTIERFLWSGVAATLYLPIFDSIWKGNVSAVQSFQVGLILGGGALAGVGLASGVLLKLTPAALIPAAAVRRGVLLRTAVIAGVITVALSALMSPGAWLDFIRIQVNLLTGPSADPTNIHPASIAAVWFPTLPALAGAARLASLVFGVGAVLVAIWTARRPNGWPSAVTLGVVAMLLIPGSAWYHYLAVLLPLAAYAWPRANSAHRLVLIAGAALVSGALLALPLAVVGATLLIGAVLAATIPRAEPCS